MSAQFSQHFLDGVRDFVLINWDFLISESSPDTTVVVAYDEQGLGANMAVRSREEVRKGLTQMAGGEASFLDMLDEPAPMGALLVTVLAPNGHGSTKVGFLVAHRDQPPKAQA